MFCSKCGSSNDNDALFCENCGAPLKKADVLVDVQTADLQEDDQVNNQINTESYTNQIENDSIQNDSIQSDSIQSDSIQSDSADSVALEKNYEDQTENNASNSNKNKKVKYKFSIKRFVFSLISMLCAITACVSMIFNYVDIDYKVVYDDSTVENSELKAEYNAVEIAKSVIDNDKKFEDKSDLFYTYTNADSKFVLKGLKVDGEKIRNVSEFKKGVAADCKNFNKKIDLLKILIFGLGCGMLLVAIIHILMYTFLRKKGTYILGMLFSLASALLAGYIIYFITTVLPNDIVKVFETSGDYLKTSLGGKLNALINAEYPIGLIIAIAAEAVVFICSIILLTCKRVEKDN